jgi:hypothetical protein
MKLDPSMLCLHINEGFGEMPYPGDEHVVRDNSGFHLECEKIKSALKGQHWRDVSFDTLNHLRSALSFLSAEGYRFYLPAFMVISIVDYPHAGVIPYELIQSLTLPHMSDIDRMRELAKLHPEMQPFSSAEWIQVLKTLADNYRTGAPEHTYFERVSGFNADQCKVIHQFLEYLSDVHSEDFPNREPEIAIERYWHQF